jgi:hypothetical protein
MTHNELLEKIDETINDSPVTDPQHPTYLGLNALRVVVELCEPSDSDYKHKHLSLWKSIIIKTIEKELG